MSSTTSELSSSLSTYDEIIARFENESEYGSLMSFNTDFQEDYENNDNIINQVNQLFERDYLFLDKEKEDKKYYIGFYTIVKTDNNPTSCDPYEMLLNSTISPRSFFLFSLNVVEKYLHDFSIIYRNYYKFKPNVEILQLHINPATATYNIVVKTYWLRLIQKWWKKICAKQKAIQLHKMKISNMRHFEIYGNWGFLNSKRDLI
jgi:hypothetical protein